MEEREEAAKHCAADLGLKIPIVMDDMQDSVEKAYAGWPDRIYVVAKDGKIAFAGRPGPAGFKPAEAKQALASLDRS